VELPLGEWSIRSYRADDVAALARAADNPRVAAGLRDLFPQPYSEDDGREWISSVLAARPETHFAIAAADEVIGTIGLTLQSDVHRRSAELGYWLGEPWWGRGIATLAVRAVTPWAFERFDLLRIFATVFSNNPASARVLEKAGYELEGTLRRAVVKDGRILDQRMYASVR